MAAKGRPENLVPQAERSPEEAREMGRKGGVASGAKRRQKKLLSQLYGEYLLKEYEVKINGRVRRLQGASLVEEAWKRIIARGDSTTVSLLREMREATEGSKSRVGLAHLEGEEDEATLIGQLLAPLPPEPVVEDVE